MFSGFVVAFVRLEVYKQREGDDRIVNFEIEFSNRREQRLWTIIQDDISYLYY